MKEAPTATRINTQKIATKVNRGKLITYILTVQLPIQSSTLMAIISTIFHSF
jgi:hypothetical protein